MNRWRGKVAVVTGASSGIGFATAKALLNEGLIVVGLARRFEKMMDEMKDNPRRDQFHARACDVTKESDVIEAFKYVEENFGALHVLINNAGTVTLKSVQHSSTDEIEKIVKVNLLGVVYCSKKAIKLMRETAMEAHILNINSILGRRVPPPIFGHFNIYPATKFAVTALSESLQYDLLNQKYNISPGAVKTDMLDYAVQHAPLMSQLPELSPDDIANSIVFALSVPPHVEISELTIQGKKMDF
ncbi:unnamed protein product [Trichogramma brassicae]|uniref:Dehydrogenase n=1 Tax=Trichogramma brassicae TaxID=86971 RepID=A0A6H5I7X4_9HYME|nr:unnamed protein product [Trichogramma brassicae]